MNHRAQICKRHPCRRRAAAFLALLIFLSGHFVPAFAHPLGNFTINHFTRLEISASRVRVHYVIDMAEIPAYQELFLKLDVDKDNSTPSAAALEAYATRAANDYLNNLRLTVDGAVVPLTVVGKLVTLPPGQGGLPTLRIEADYTGDLPPQPAGGNNNNNARRLSYTDANYAERIGWREIAVSSTGGVQIFDSTAFGNGLSNELREYPEDKLAAPLDERTAELSFTLGALPPAGARALVTREGGKVEVARDRLAELINVENLTLGVALAGLLLAALLGGFHALSPGHGKTVVAAYLIGSRGTAKHAAFLGLTVTITHTAGVFALGIVTLFAAQYVVPEKLYPILGFVSGAIVVAIGLSLLVRRIGAVYGYVPHEHASHSHDGDGGDGHAPHSHDQTQLHSHAHDGGGGAVHSHGGGREHSHLPPGTDGGAVTWRSLLALGISGGLLPCPSALVVLLAAIAAHRVGYGLLLVVSFSIGLASVLTAIGLLFVYARRWMERPLSASGMLVRVLPALSAFAITCAGLFICYQAVGEAGYSVAGLGRSLLVEGRELFSHREPEFAQMSALAVLGLGLVFGLKHATEVDHVVAVSSIVSEQRKLWRAALVGGLWGLGHTASLVIVGTVVLVLRVAIPERVANGLEFCVALMIIGLGVATLVRATRRRGSPVHLHQHRHDGLAHAHLHFHEPDTEHEEALAPHSHAVTRIGIKPLIVGAMHGLAGSAALTLLVLAQIPSPLLGLLYLAVFGLGSIVGMLLMSGLVGLPFVLSVRKLTGLHYGLQAGAGVLSVCFGLWYAYETGIANGLLGATF